MNYFLCVLGVLCGYESIMQNKPNFLNAQMNISFSLTKYYENKPLFGHPENKPKQTQPVVSAVESTCGELACTERSRSVEPTCSERSRTYLNTKND